MKAQIMILTMLLTACGTDSEPNSSKIIDDEARTTFQPYSHPLYDRSCVDAKAEGIEDRRLPLILCRTQSNGVRETVLVERSDYNVNADTCEIQFESIGLKPFSEAGGWWEC